MFNCFTSRQPLFLTASLFGLGAASLLPIFTFNAERASAEPQLAIGDRVSSLNAIANMPDGQHQFCSEPEPKHDLGAGTCYWFSKTGNQLIGYYGIPHSDIFIDCVSGTIKNEKVVGEALTIAGEGTPFPNVDNQKSLTWKTISLGAGQLEYKAAVDHGEITLVKFDKAELTLRDFYRYSPAKVRQMNKPPSSCSVQDWIKQLATL